MSAAPSLAAELWTASRIGTFQTCARKERYRYVLGIDGGTSDVARFGSVGHAALEQWLLNFDKIGPFEGDEDATVRDTIAHRSVEALPDVYERARLHAVLTGYFVRWGSVEWRVLAVELEFGYQLGDVTIAGKIDAIVEVLSGSDAGCYVVEHKFTKMDSAPGSAYWERLTIDAQVSIYVDGARCAGYDVRGVIYDVVAKPGHEPARATPVELRRYTQPIDTKGKGCPECGGRVGGKQGPKQGTGLVASLNGPVEIRCASCAGTGWREAPRSEPSRLYANQRETDELPEQFEARVLEAIAASPDTYYRRAIVVRLEHELPAMRSDILDTVRLARVAHIFEIAPRSTGACSKFGSLCSYFDACSGRVSIDDTARFQRARPHAELAAPTTTP